MTFTPGTCRYCATHGDVTRDLVADYALCRSCADDVIRYLQGKSDATVRDDQNKVQPDTKGVRAPDT